MQGADTLEGGKGADALHAGKGRDVFVATDGDRRDVVTDRQDGRDRIRIDAQGVGFRDLKIVQRGDDARIVRGAAKGALIL
ncbi:MAG: hypothetical protein AAF192_15930 [Pseudomonadota bacterium]